ncbi:MAG: SGNH/GDSL hydrolase family protein [Candidatus Omnitrophica bacterium]|nr:SGNH/GDSL hydrolase family protein [Candidatus Omnitrophota bacterium]MDD5552839.1 SGNH/GDSL hydrolase family protein [Candidatus Omnitrophota bacterium]
MKIGKKGLYIIFLSLILLFFILLLEFSAKAFFWLSKSTDKLILTGDSRIYDNKPGIAFVNKYGIKVYYNSLGFIGKEIGDKHDDIFRILGVGDSVTAGTYLPQDQRYINRLGEILADKTNKRIEIINAGVGGYNTWQELESIKGKGLSVNPDLIIVGVCLNDYINNKPKLKKSWFNMVIENLRDGSKARYLDFLYQRSDLYKFFYDFFSTGLRMRFGDAGYHRYLENYNFEIKPEDFKNWKAAFSDMISLVKSHKKKILFTIFPLENQIINKEEDSYKPLSQFFKEEGIYYIDLIKDFKREAKQSKILYMKRDIIHPTSIGHSIVAQAISKYIIDNNILDN